MPTSSAPIFDPYTDFYDACGVVTFEWNDVLKHKSDPCWENGVIATIWRLFTVYDEKGNSTDYKIKIYFKK